MAVTGSAFDFPVFKRLMLYLKPYKSTLAFSFILTISLALLSPVRPWLIQYTFDHHIQKKDHEGLLWVTLLMVLSLIVETVIQFYDTYTANRLGQNVIKDVRSELYGKIISFKLRYFDKTPIGTLVTRVVSDIETIAEIFSQGILVIIGDVLKLTIIIGVMFYTDWRLALISLSSLPLLLLSTYIFKNAIKASFQEVRTEVARLNTFVQEHITGMNIVQIFNREEAEMEKFKTINNRHAKAHIRSVFYYSVFFPVVEILSAVSVGLLVWWGAGGVMDGKVTLGNLVAFIMYINMLYRPIRQLADRFNSLQMGIVSSERVFKIIDTKESIRNYGNLDAREIRGSIEFKNVWFAYQDEEWILKDVSFKVNPGETFALVGATGSGKSSIINLLNRFYEFQKGTIEIDSVDIWNYELGSLRKSISVIMQDVFLFSDTIEKNITLNNNDISFASVVEAAESVGANNFIKKLPGGYDYNVRERGGMLSAGQRQLIAFIRAAVYKPKILILDEATSSIDTESEILIQEATEKITKNITSIVIAHRLATVQQADKIIVLDHGKILEAGNHQQLLMLKGHYKKLFELQFKETPKEAV